MTDVRWVCQSFEEVSNHQLYAILRLRSEVFVVEQHCVFQDIDNKDQHSFHLMGWQKDHLVAYCRLLPKGIAYEYVSIGRVVTSPASRSAGIGKMLMQEAVTMCDKLFGLQPIKIGGQLYLKKFYESLGFLQTSDIYLEDGIEHIEMLLDRKL